jgi:type IV pilus assembly protein PilC
VTILRPRHVPATPPTPRTPEEHLWDVTLWVLKLLAWAVAGLALLGGLGMFVGLAIVPVLGAGTPFALILLLVLAVSMLAALRRRRMHAVVAYLEQATRLNLPLPAMLRAAEESEGMHTARALRALRVELESGRSVHDALGRAMPSIPPRTVGLVGSAERAGRLPHALARLSHDAVTRFGGRPPGAELYLRWYPPTVLLMIGLIVTCVYVFVLPKFFDIYQDFAIELPWETVWLKQTWDYVAVPLAVLVIGGTLVYVGRMLASIFVPSTLSHGPLRWLTERLAWHVPGARAVTRWRGYADTCYVMADALEAGHPLDWALAEASRSGANVVLADQLALWGDHARAGEPAAEGARGAGMPPLMVGLLRTAGGADLPDLFRFLARYYDGRFARSTVVLQASLVPAMSLALGAAVGFIVVALFLPLVRLVNHLSDIIWRM